MALIAHCLVENVTKEQPGNYKRGILQGVSTILTEAGAYPKLPTEPNFF